MPTHPPGVAPRKPNDTERQEPHSTCRASAGRHRPGIYMPTLPIPDSPSMGEGDRPHEMIDSSKCSFLSNVCDLFRDSELVGNTCALNIYRIIICIGRGDSGEIL